jgi:virginiamycin B lyase
MIALMKPFVVPQVMRHVRPWHRRAAVAVLSVCVVAFASVAPAGEAHRTAPAVIQLDGSVSPQGIAGVAGHDGMVWFAAAHRGAVGEIDPLSRSVGYIALGHGARPRGLAHCPDGRLYALDPALNVIHEITPATEEVKRHPMPGGQTADLSGAVCTTGNMLFFTGYNGWLGRLDTASGEVSLLAAQGARGPGQMALAPSGSVWFASYAANKIVRVDPISMRQDAFAMPAGVEGPKGIAVDATGRVWVTAYRSARVARFDPRRRSWDAWTLGEGTRPFALTLDASGAVLVSDIGRNALIRLDPASGSSEVVAQLSDRGQARHLARVGQQVWISESAVDRVLVVETAAPVAN